jgi:hypothetical protein
VYLFYFGNFRREDKKKVLLFKKAPLKYYSVTLIAEGPLGPC